MTVGAEGWPVLKQSPIRAGLSVCAQEVLLEMGLQAAVLWGRANRAVS